MFKAALQYKICNITEIVIIINIIINCTVNFEIMHQETHLNKAFTKNK